MGGLDSVGAEGDRVDTTRSGIANAEIPELIASNIERHTLGTDVEGLQVCDSSVLRWRGWLSRRTNISPITNPATGPTRWKRMQCNFKNARSLSIWVEKSNDAVLYYGVMGGRTHDGDSEFAEAHACCINKWELSVLDSVDELNADDNRRGTLPIVNDAKYIELET